MREIINEAFTNIIDKKLHIKPQSPNTIIPPPPYPKATPELQTAWCKLVFMSKILPSQWEFIWSKIFRLSSRPCTFLSPYSSHSKSYFSLLFFTLRSSLSYFHFSRWFCAFWKSPPSHKKIHSSLHRNLKVASISSDLPYVHSHQLATVYSNTKFTIGRNKDTDDYKVDMHIQMLCTYRKYNVQLKYD